jgi:hypothetical protein
MMTKFAHCLDYLCKEAEEPVVPPAPAAPPGELPPKKSPWWEGAKVLGSSLAGFGLGQIGGALAGRGIEYVTKRQGGDPVEMAKKVGPIVGAAAGFLYPMWRAREQQEITNAVESARDHNERRVSGQ